MNTDMIKTLRLPTKHYFSCCFLVIKWGKLVPARFISAKLGLGDGPELIAGDAAGLFLCSYLSFFICFDNLVAECASLPMMLPRTTEAKVESLLAALAANVWLRGKTATLSHLRHFSNLSHTQSDGCSLDIKRGNKRNTKMVLERYRNIAATFTAFFFVFISFKWLQKEVAVNFATRLQKFTQMVDKHIGTG